MSVRAKVYFLLLSLAVLGGGGYFLHQKFGLPWVAKADSKADPKGKKKDDKKSESTPVELATAVKGEISAFIASTANLRALRDVAIASQSEGIVKKVLVEEGDYVKEGQALCVLDDTQHRIRLELTREKLAQAKLQLDKARIRQEKAVVQIDNTKAEFERHQKAFKEGLVSEKEVATYKYRLDEFEHDHRASSSETKELGHHVAELEADIAQAELEISRTQIRAPFAGFVTQRTVDIGQRVRNLDNVFNIGAFSPLYADVFLAEREAYQVRPSQAAVVRLGMDNSKHLTGRVERISPVVDQATGTVKVTIALQPQGSDFRPGAFVRVEIRTDTRAEAVLIPKRAVLEQDGETYVFVANGDTTKRLAVVLGYENEGRVEIRRGIAPGQKVVVAGQGALKEGSKIKVIQG